MSKFLSILLILLPVTSNGHVTLAGRIRGTDNAGPIDIGENDLIDCGSQKSSRNMHPIDISQFFRKDIEQHDRKLSSRNEKEVKATERVIVQYTNEKSRKATARVAKKVYYDFKQYNFTAIEVDAEGLASLAANIHISDIEPDSKWKEQGKFEKYITIDELENSEMMDPKLFQTSEQEQTPHFQHRNAMNLKSKEKVPYGITMTQADQMFYGWRGEAMVCIVDTGVLASHPDLNPDLLNGTNRDFLSWNVDVRGHGTHIAGTISAKANNNYGVRGMGDIPIYVTRGLDDDGYARESDIIDAIEQCEAAGTKVISLSLSGGSMSQSMRNVIDRLYTKNILVVAAAGNDGIRYQSFPASYNKVISVGAVGEDEVKWTYSNFGPWVELTAPGHMIVSTGLYANGEYKFAIYSGTSMATPHVAAAAALLWSHYPDCTPTQIRYALAHSAKDKGIAGCDDFYGFGIVQVKNAFDFLSQYSCANSNWGQIVGNGQCSAIDTRPVS